jgi:glycosyltransferase involved in cell wall biosynthesis
MPVSTDWYTPKPDLTVSGRIGFTGRFDDPRKNIGLLLEAFALVRQRHAMATLTLIGGVATDEIAATARRLGLGDAVRFISRLEGEALRAEIQSFDVFVVPSYQEGLCIAALEAMACGVPVVSTRCGGPAEFVLPGVTGELVGFAPTELAEAVGGIIADREYRTRLSQGARRLVETRYTHQHAKSVFLEAFFREFPELKKEHKKGF